MEPEKSVYYEYFWTRLGSWPKGMEMFGWNTSMLRGASRERSMSEQEREPVSR